jgi:heptosyltransferase-2
MVVTHDTGLMHIAVAYKKPVVSLRGNTVPSFGMYPYYPGNDSRYEIIQVNKLWCRPCSKIGYDKCPLGHFRCMNKIEVSDVIAAVNKRL